MSPSLTSLHFHLDISAWPNPVCVCTAEAERGRKEGGREGEGGGIVKGSRLMFGSLRSSVM